MQAVIMAGGRGTRLAALRKTRYRSPWWRWREKPLLLWQVERLKAHGITDILMVIGHLGEKIQEYFGDGGAFLGYGSGILWRKRPWAPPVPSII